MKDIFVLTKVLLKNSFNSNNNSKNKIGKIVLYILVYGYLLGFIAYVSYECINSLKIFNMESIFLEYCFFSVFLLCIIQTIFSSLNVLFFSSDIEDLLTYPIMPIKIVISKLNCLIISEYYTCMIFLVPAFLVYGILLKCSIFFYLYGIIVFLIFPIIPVSIIAFIITVIMKFTQIVKNKEFVQYASVALTIILIIVLQFLIGSASSNNITNIELAEMLISKSNSIENTYKVFFNLELVNKSILNFYSYEGIINLLILFIVSIFIYAVINYVLSLTYIKMIKKVNSLKSKKHKKENIEKKFQKNSLVKSYVLKEFKNLTRNPIFFMQCVLPSLLFPFIFSIPIITSYNSSKIEEYNIYEKFLDGKIISSESLGINIVIIILLFTFNFIAVTAISRDKSDAILMKQFPISLEKQCFYKILPGIIINIFPILYVIVFEKIFFLEFNFKIILPIFIISMLISIFNNYIGIIIDLKNPKLSWDSEYVVVKQNINMFFQMVINIIESVVVICFASIMNFNTLSIFLSLLFVIGIFGVKRYLRKKARYLFRKII